MKVKQLKEALKEYDDELEVVIYNGASEDMAQLDELSLVKHYSDEELEENDPTDYLPYVKGDYPWIVLDNKDSSFLMLGGD